MKRGKRHHATGIKSGQPRGACHPRCFQADACPPTPMYVCLVDEPTARIPSQVFLFLSVQTKLATIASSLFPQRLTTPHQPQHALAHLGIGLLDENAGLPILAFNAVDVVTAILTKSPHACNPRDVVSECTNFWIRISSVSLK